MVKTGGVSLPYVGSTPTLPTMTTKERILELRQQGKTYNEIVEIVGCTKSLVCYYCGDNQKAKTRHRQRAMRGTNFVQKKLEHFKYDKPFQDRVRDFQSRLVGTHRKKEYDKNFDYKAVLEKFGDNPTCYLTGRLIDLNNSKSYSFDHIIPLAKDGASDLDNLGLTCKEANHAKYDLTVDEFLALCKEVLEHHGYDVQKR